MNVQKGENVTYKWTLKKGKLYNVIDKKRIIYDWKLNGIMWVINDLWVFDYLCVGQ